MVRPRGSIPISLPCRALTARGSLERQFRNGTRPGHRFHVFLICVYYITIKPVCQPQILPRLATLHTLSSQKVYAREGVSGRERLVGTGGLFYYISFQRGLLPPLKPLRSKPGLSVPLGGARGAEPRLVEGLQGDPSPCGGIQRGACPPLRKIVEGIIGRGE